MDNKQLAQDISAIYKMVHEHTEIHRNTLRKKLLQSKIPSQKRFNEAFSALLNHGKLTLNKEMISITPSGIYVGVIKQKDNDHYVVLSSPNKQFKLTKSVASGYHVGDIVDVTISEDNQSAIILGRSAKKPEPVKPKTQQEKGTKASTSVILGRVIKLSHDELVFIPNKKNLPARQIPILNEKEELSSFQDKICLMKLTDPEAPILGGNIIEVKGDAGNPIHEYDAIAESYGAIMSWEGDRIQNEINAIPTSVNVDELDLISEKEAKTNPRGKTVDLTHLNFATIDPATCKDMDDAIYSTYNENGDIVVYTAVANVSKYFSLYSEIGKRYLQGAFTIYAPNKAYNILPTKLSTGVCSLNPNEPRLALVVKSTLDKKTGKVIKSRIYDALIKSRHKYSYEEAQEIVDQEKLSCPKDYLFDKINNGEELSPNEQIIMNYYAGNTIKLGFDNRKMIRFVSNNEREILFDESREDVKDIVAIPHLMYHEIIEAFMITANEATAKFARDNNIPNIYRIHDEPRESKLNRANEFFKILGIEFDGDLSASGTRALIELIKETPAEETINNFLIKMQSRAVYSNKLYGGEFTEEQSEMYGERISHYALQSHHYSHSTAPIRRLPDYLTHYNILAHIHGTKQISQKTIEQIIEVANNRQIDVDQAEKDFEDISSVLYCEKHIGETMHGRISKMRYTAESEGYDDEIVVIVKNQEKGINVEIPLSQILGNKALGCNLSREKCAVYNNKGDILLSICKPIDFVIERADRKSMIVVGRTNKQLIKDAEIKSTDYRGYHNHPSSQSKMHDRNKNNRRARIESKNTHHYNKNNEEEYEM